MLTHKKLLEILYYDQDTGNWFWIIDIKQSNLKSGDKAGYINKGRNIITISGKKYFASRLAWFYMKGYWPEYEIDHKDQNSLNDKWLNLKHTTHQCNMKNRGLMKNNTSGVVGVKKRKGKWLAGITVNKIQIHLGTFKKFYDAVKARWDAEVKYNFTNCCTTSLAYKYLTMKRVR